ncbi:DsbA family protein [Brenneria populi subsp. brevivirga]|uniref:DsbA family oxidoreductase n=1 Tax=Brenneria populi TaxID=1505588 RepID=UPI002E17348B|nr:DsbA family protein [Brenneria populi subsp. brevivirga]
MSFKIDLYSEISCPWCFVGHHRLDKVLGERFPGVNAEVIHHPVLLFPDAPREGIYIPEMLRQRYGITEPKQAFARPESEAHASGFPLDLSRQCYAYPTQSAHAILLDAREKGTQHQLAVAITDAYFLEAKDIGDVEVLADIASNYGFSHDEAIAIALSPAWRKRVDEAAAKSAAAGVSSVPYFVFAGSVAIGGGCSEDKLELAMNEALKAIEIQ